MKELVVISGKGGTGKTSVTAAFASLAGDMVLADCDVDAADLHLLLQPEIQNQGDFTGGKRARIDAQKCTACGRCRELCRFDAISLDFAVMALSCEGCGVCVWNCPENAISFTPQKNGDWYESNTRYGPMVHAKLGIAEENSGKLVSLVREKARNMAKERNKEMVLIDGPPGTGCAVIAAIGRTDYALIVTEPTKSAIHDMERVIKVCEFFKVPVMVCLNKHDLNDELAEKIKKFCDDKNIPVAGEIPFDRQFTSAQVSGKSIVEHARENITGPVKKMWQRIIKQLYETDGNPAGDKI